jgi:cytochrome c553
MKSRCVGILFLAGTIAFAQATIRQLMLDLIYPSSNEILLAIYRGGPPDKPKDEKEWAAVRRAALTLAESGNMLTMPGRARDQGDWMKDAKLLVDAGNAAYKAAQAKDANALAALAGTIDASCTTCHKQYRPNVFPKEGGSK